MLISWFHDNHWKRRAGNKSRCERGSGLFHGLCKKNSRDSLRWKVSDGHSSKSFVLVVQSQYIINAEFYESKLQPQWCSPFKRLWIRIWNQEDLLPGGTWAVVAYQFLWSCTSVLGKKVKGFLSLSLRKHFELGCWGVRWESLALLSRQPLNMGLSYPQWRGESAEAEHRSHPRHWHSWASGTNDKKSQLAVFPSRNMPMTWHPHGRFPNASYS